jgi:hypothetical protein
MRHQHQLGAPADALLDDRLDRRAGVAEQLRDLREHARAVVDLHVDVEGGEHIFDDLQALARAGQRRRAGERREDVAEHCARGLRAARPRSRHRDLGDRLRLDRDRVEGTVDRRQRVPVVEEGRVHAHGDAAGQPLGGADQLQRQPQLAGVGDVVACDPGDALVANVVDVHGRAECQPREDRHLRGRVGAADVVGRVGFRDPEPLRLAQRLQVVAAAARHLGEDEVGRAVDDPVDALDVGAGERVAQHAHDRHDAGDRRLEAEQHRVLAGERPQLLAVAGEQLLIGGDDVAAGAQRAAHVLAGRVDTADQLDDQIGLLEDLGEVALGARQHACDRRAPAADPLDRVGALGKQRLEGAADGAVAEQADAQGGHRAQTSRACRSSRVSRRTTTRASPSLAKITGARGTPL